MHEMRKNESNVYPLIEAVCFNEAFKQTTEQNIKEKISETRRIKTQ